jgi:uncharacterized membrane protein YsdA (DUF1294 family)
MFGPTKMEINQQLAIIILIFGLINLLAFLIMLVDKVKSEKPGVTRISEGLLFFMATVFGSFGVYAGMFAFRHKTRKWYFLIGIPLLMIQNSALVYLVYLTFFQTITL